MSAVALLGRLLRGVRAGNTHSITTAHQLATDHQVRLTSNAFDHASAMPAPHHGGRGAGRNISPHLSWGDLPEGTAQLLLVLEDTDVPAPRPAIHMIALFEATLHELPPGALSKDNPAIRYVPATLRSTGYAGPRALPGHGTHHYDFHLYTLDHRVPTDTAVPNLKTLLRHVEGHVTAHGHLQGTQERH